jgi:hypothetical protein
MTRTPGEYVYHAGYLPRGLESVKHKGLIPSKHGYAGSGVYFAYEPDEGFYHVDAADATMFRVRWLDLVDKFGVYPKNPNGIQRDDQEIIVSNTVPADMLEVEYFPGEWWDINSAAAADRGLPVNEASLVTDVPREEWLEDKIAYAKKRGRDSFGVPYMGSTTAYVRQPSHVVLPVSLLARIPGARGEQKNVRQEDLAAIMKIMKDTGKLPLTSRGEEYKPFVCVAWNGEPWVMEGNHRIMAADRLGWDTLPVELKYFDGGERIRSGLLYPGKIGLGEVENSRETDENPLVVVYDKDGELHTHANLSVANNIFRTSVKPNEVFKGPVKVKSGGSYGEVTFDLSKHHTSEAVAETGTTVVMNEEPIKLKSQDAGRAREFIDAVYARYPYTFQNNHVISWGSGEEQQVAMFELVPSFGRPNAVEIKWIQAYPLRKGVGSRAMKELQGMAKEHGVALTLFPWDKGRVSQAKLMKFYRGHGFQPTVKGAKNMIWRPEVGVREAETGTAYARDISREFRKLGYSKIGSGADSTIWAKDDSHVIKILMPEDEGSQAVEVFKKFYEFCQERTDIPCLPVFNEYNTIDVLDKEYIQIDMERLYPVKKNTFEEAMIWYLSDYVARGTPWPQVKQELSDPHPWINSHWPRHADQLAAKVSSLSGANEAAWNLLYSVMAMLYKTGRINKMGWDLHTENVMRRANGQLVIIDPWFADASLLSESTKEVGENFADGRKPGRKGLAKRMGVDCSKSVAELRRLAAASSGERQRMAHWCANMKSGRNESFTPMQMAIMEGGHSLLDEGGWASTATQNTKITPAVIEEAVGILKEFETEFNQWQAEKGLDVEIKMGRPVGSGTYYKRDLVQDPEREYGDVDVMCYIHSREGIGAARRTSEYAAAVEEFTQGHSKYSTSNGTNVIMDTSAGPVQVDLIYTYHEHANWARMLAPEYRVKGVINTSLVSSLAEVLNLSIGVQGVQVKTRAGRPVNFRQSKDTELATVSLDPENWGADIYAYYYELAHGAKPKIPGNLAKHGGLKDEQRISDIVLTIKALVTDLEQAKLLGTGALDHVANKQDMMQQIARVLDSKLEKVINSSKFDKAATPAALEKANKTKLMLAKYRNEITKLLLN